MARVKLPPPKRDHHARKLKIAPKQEKVKRERRRGVAPDGKPDKTEMLRRVTKVEELLVAGANSSQIFQYLTEVMKIDVTERTARNYIRIANRHLARLADIDRATEVSKAKRRFDLVFNLAVSGKSRDLRSAVQAEASRAKLLGLNAPTRIDARMGTLPETEEDTLAEIERILDSGA